MEKKREKRLKSSATWVEEIRTISWPVCKHLPSYHMVPAWTCHHHCISQYKTCYFSWSRQKPRRQHVGKRENTATIIPGKPVKKPLIETKLLSWHILLHLFTRKYKKIWGASAQGCWEDQNRDTKAVWTSTRQDPPGSSWLKKDDLNFLWDCAVLCWTDLIIWGFYFELSFSPYLDMATDSKDSLFILVNPPETLQVKNPLIFTIFLLCVEQR